MSKSSAFSNDFLKLVFNGTPIANIADNASVSPLTDLYVSFHTADPGESGTQATNECTYTSYARVAVARPSGWTVTGNSVSPAAEVPLPTATGGSETATHFVVGVASSGAQKILYSGTLTPNVVIANGVTPKLKTDTAITED